MLQTDAQIIGAITKAAPQSITHIIVVKNNKDGKRQKRACAKKAQARKEVETFSTYCPDCKNRPFQFLKCFANHHK